MFALTSASTNCRGAVFPHNAMTEITTMTYLMGMGYEPRMARDVVESG
jgi:hypothetical protein